MNLNPIKFARKRPKVATAIAVVIVVGISFGLYWFQPWRLFTKQVVSEALPTAAAAVVPGVTSSGDVKVPPLSNTDLPTEPPPGPQIQPPLSSTEQPGQSQPAQTEIQVPVAETPADSAQTPAPPTAPAPPTVPTPASIEAAPAVSAEPIVLFSGDFVTQEHGTSGGLKILQLADGSRYVRLEGFSTSDGPDLHVALTDQSAGGDWFKYRDSRYHDLGALKGTDGDQNYLIPADLEINGLTSVVIWCERFSVAFGSAPLNQAG